MGYRSDVSVVFYTHDEGKLPFAALKLWFDENYPRKEAVETFGASIETGSDYVLVTYQDVKWYPDYKHVNAVTTAINRFEETFDAGDVSGTGSVELVEVGEELDDIRDRRSGFCKYRLNVRREIVFD